MTKILAWHFLKDNGSFCYGRARSPQPGGIETVSTDKRPLELCRWGLHASRNVIDALRFAEGALLRRVELSGEILRGGGKICATRRRELWRMDITNILHEFACWCAERALKRAVDAGHKVPDCYWDALEAKRAWLRGECSDKTLGKMQLSLQNAICDAALFSEQPYSLAILQVAARPLYRCPLLAGRTTSYHARELVLQLTKDYAAIKREKDAQRRKLLRMVEKARKEE